MCCVVAAKGFGLDRACVLLPLGGEDTVKDSALPAVPCGL